MKVPKPVQQGAKPHNRLRFAATFGAGLIAAVPLLQLLGVGAERLVGIGKIQSTVELQAGLINDLQNEKSKLTEKAERLQSQAHQLELKLYKTESTLALANQQLAQVSRSLEDYKTLNTQLDRKVKLTDPCISIQRVIADLEKQLAVEPAWTHSLEGPRRDEAIAQLQAHQESFRACLSSSI